MPSRLIACLIALVMLWSGLGSFEPLGAPVHADEAQAHDRLHVVADSMSAAGSAEHRHLDEQPSPSQVEPLNEGPGLLPAPLTAKAMALAMSRPRPFEAAAIRAPHLDGPLRPPCATGPST